MYRNWSRDDPVADMEDYFGDDHERDIRDALDRITLFNPDIYDDEEEGYDL